MNRILQLQKLVPLLILTTLYLVDVESAINLSFTPCLVLSKGNIKQNKLTLKLLQDKLDKLEKSVPSGSDENSNNKDSENIIVRIRKGGAPMLFILSTLLTYANRIPIINRLIGYITKRYAKTTWLLMLIKLRKLFVIINAIIGVITVFKISGYSSDNFICGLYGLGTTYVEMLTGFVKRIFVWFCDLLDFKVVPNVPKGPGSNINWKWWGPKENTWYTKPMGVDGFSKITELANNQDFYKGPFGNTGNNSNWSFVSILYYGSIALITLGTLYLGYKIYCDITTPRYVSLGKLPDFSNYPDHPNNNSSTIDSITKLFSGATASFIAFNKSVFSVLNPYNYMSTPIDSGESREAFMARQQSANDYNSKYWPYTEVNPFHSYFHKWRIYLLGETLIEQELREHTAKTFKDRAYLNAKYGEVSAHIPSGSTITPHLGEWNRNTCFY